MPEYVERSALNKALTAAAVNGSDKARRTWAKAICVLYDMPTADVVPVKHGHWISLDDGRTAGCSNCDGEIIVTEIAYEQKRQTMMFNLFCNNYHWCPKCGAKMDEVSE